MAKPGRKPKQPSAAGGNGAQAASKAAGETVSGYFRAVFRENPKLLRTRSNQEVLQRWLTDHAGHAEVPEQVKQILSNIKSVLRKKRRQRKSAVHAEPGQPSSIAPITAKRLVHRLEALEVKIDECLADARELDAEGLVTAIQHLRRARNEVVWKLGE
jgi:hypothetical protein